MGKREARLGRAKTLERRDEEKGISLGAITDRVWNVYAVFFWLS